MSTVAPKATPRQRGQPTVAARSDHSGLQLLQARLSLIYSINRHRRDKGQEPRPYHHAGLVNRVLQAAGHTTRHQLAAAGQPIPAEGEAQGFAQLKRLATNGFQLIFDDRESQGQFAYEASSGNVFELPPHEFGPINEIGEPREGLPIARAEGVWVQLNPVQANPVENSRRSEKALSGFAWAAMEFDALAEEAALSILAALPLGFATITHSGSRSPHGVFPTSARTAGEFRAFIQELKPLLVAVGADPGAFSVTQLSRLAGVTREENKQRQELLFASAAGFTGPINRKSPFKTLQNLTTFIDAAVLELGIEAEVAALRLELASLGKQPVKTAHLKTTKTAPKTVKKDKTAPSGNSEANSRAVSMALGLRREASMCGKAVDLASISSKTGLCVNDLGRLFDKPGFDFAGGGHHGEHWGPLNVPCEFPLTGKRLPSRKRQATFKVFAELAHASNHFALKGFTVEETVRVLVLTLRYLPHMTAHRAMVKSFNKVLNLGLNLRVLRPIDAFSAAAKTGNQDASRVFEFLSYESGATDGWGHLLSAMIRSLGGRPQAAAWIRHDLPTVAERFWGKTAYQSLSPVSSSILSTIDAWLKFNLLGKTDRKFTVREIVLGSETRASAPLRYDGDGNEAARLAALSRKVRRALVALGCRQILGSARPGRDSEWTVPEGFMGGKPALGIGHTTLDKEEGEKKEVGIERSNPASLQAEIVYGDGHLTEDEARIDVNRLWAPEGKIEKPKKQRKRTFWLVGKGNEIDEGMWLATRRGTKFKPICRLGTQSEVLKLERNGRFLLRGLVKLNPDQVEEAVLFPVEQIKALESVFVKVKIGCIEEIKEETHGFKLGYHAEKVEMGLRGICRTIGIATANGGNEAGVEWRGWKPWIMRSEPAAQEEAEFVAGILAVERAEQAERMRLKELRDRKLAGRN